MTSASVRFFAPNLRPIERPRELPSRPNDMWIAAATMECGGHLLTFDRDFERIPGLEHTLLVA